MISVIVASWNTREYTEGCLTTLVRQDGIPRGEIIVVDNGSCDGTIEMINEKFPAVTVVNTGSNLGFARATNIGLRRAKGDYLCLINSDVEVPPGCLSRMYQYMEANPDVGALGPRMYGPDGRVHRSCMRFPTIWNCLCDSLGFGAIFRGSRVFGGLLMSDFTAEETADVDILNGWFLMIRREALEEIGLLDERFFIYGEDLDWSYRCYKARWRRVYFSAAYALHFGAGSSRVAPSRFYVEMAQANLQFWRKHRGRLGSFVYASILWLHECIRLLGHGVVFLAYKPLRSDARAKLRRTSACIRWLAVRKCASRAINL